MIFPCPDHFVQCVVQKLDLRSEYFAQNILHRKAELQTTEDILLKTEVSLLQIGHILEN